MRDDAQFIKDVIQWDVKNWSKALPFWEKHVKDFENKKAMTFGEREGGLSLWLASKNVEVVCTDYNEFPEETADLHRRYSVDDKITYEKQDITQINAPDNSYDFVMFKSVIGALASDERQQQAIDEIYRILKPGGYLLLAENMEGTLFHKWMRKKFTSWSGYWHYPKFKNSPKLYRNFSKSSFRSHGFFAVFGRSEKQRKAIGSVDKLVSPITPKGWRYILFGVCQK